MSRPIITLMAILSLCLTAELRATPVNAPQATIQGISLAKTPKHTVSIAIRTLANMKTTDIEKLLGRKLHFKEKIGLKLLKWKVKYEDAIQSPFRKADETKHDKGKTAKVLGIIALVTVFIPYVNFASIPLAITAIIIGSKAKKNNPNDKNAKTGITLGIIALATIVFLLLLAAILVFAYLSLLP